MYISLSSELQWYRSDWLGVQPDLLLCWFSGIILSSGLIHGCFFVQIKRSNRGLSGRVLDSRTRVHGFEPHCVVSLSKNINPSLELVQHRKTRPFITERLLMGREEFNQTN